MDFISGEKIQFLCDHFIGTQSTFAFNPNVRKYRERFVQLGSRSRINNKPLVFCSTHILDDIPILVDTLRNMKKPFKLIFHNSDGAFSDKHLVLFSQLPLLQHIYTQNMCVIHPRVTPLPIGVANSQWKHGDAKIHKDIYNMSVPKTENIYFNFSVDTNRGLRRDCYDKLSRKNIKWNSNKSYRDYLIELKRHRYAICPEGCGTDTHRFWECLYMNVIPICKRSILADHYKKYFPIVILDDWSALDLKMLDDAFPKLNINHDYLDLMCIKTLLMF